MRKVIKTLLILAMLASVVVAGELAYGPNATAQTPDDTGQTLPYYMEPLPICNSELAITSAGQACTPADSAGVVAVGTRICPALSAGRFAGGSYDYVSDPLGVNPSIGITYNNPGQLSVYQAEDNARTWRMYCVIPFVSQLPATPEPTAEPTPTPDPTATPETALPLACPVGTRLVTPANANPFCEVIAVAVTGGGNNGGGGISFTG